MTTIHITRDKTTYSIPAVELDEVTPADALRFEDELAELPEREQRYFLGCTQWEQVMWERGQLIVELLSLPKAERPKAAALDPRNRMVVRLNLWAAHAVAGVPVTLAEVMRLPMSAVTTTDTPEPKQPQDRQGKAAARTRPAA